MGGISRVFIYCVPDFRVVIFQYLLSSIYRDFVVSDGCIVSRSCFGQARVRVSYDSNSTRGMCPVTEFINISLQL